MRRLLISFAIAIAACVPPQEDPNAISPSSPSPTPPSSAVIAASDAPGATPAPTSTSTSRNDDTSTPTTIELHSDCTDPVPLFLGDKPKFGSGTKTSVSPNSTTNFPRNGDGTLTVWITDDQENGLASVHITKRMKKILIGRSCRTLDAH